jgi:hypothetical protein
MRTKVLIKNGHTDIDIIELKHAMTKDEAVAYLISIDFDNGNQLVRAAQEAEATKRSEKPTAANKQPKKTKEAKKPKAPAKKSTPSLDAIQARAKATKAVPKSTVSKAEVTAMLAEAEDAPF